MKSKTIDKRFQVREADALKALEFVNSEPRRINGHSKNALIHQSITDTANWGTVRSSRDHYNLRDRRGIR